MDFPQLQQIFGFSDFLPGQDKVITAVCEGRDCCVIMPTGAGKSLCYQLPALIRDGYSLIVSPLISLMVDQVEALRSRDIPAAYVNSSLTRDQQQTILEDTARGLYKLLYVAPERLRSRWMQQLLTHHPPSHLVVDEAHCISQWGHDFRPDYLRIGECCSQYNIPQVSAFTATATPEVREDIVRQLRRPGMMIHVSGFQRPNLKFSVVECHKDAEKTRVLNELLKSGKPTIIYTSTRKAVEHLAPDIGGIPYHAGMSAEKRTQAQARFMSDPCPVLVATNAFGMGIDRADIRQVIHFNIPGSLEAYYQEAGRAGRDGQPADCILLSSFRDRFIHEFLIEVNNPSEKLLTELYSLLRRKALTDGKAEVDVSPSELAPRLIEAKSESHVSAALSILEKLGVIERGYRREAYGLLTFTGDPAELMQVHQLQNTQRSRLIFRCLQQGGDRVMAGLNCTLEQISQVAGLSAEQTRRVLSALNGTVLTWTPPHASRTVIFTDLQNEVPVKDIQALQTKRELDFRRLREVIGYTETTRCRQKTIIAYFGQDTGDWTCGCCDNCGGTNHPRTAAEQELVQTILQTVCDLAGRFGRTRVAEILAGEKSDQVINRDLDRRKDFGALTDYSVRQLLGVIRTLERDELIVQTGDEEYPTIDISAEGLKMLDERQATGRRSPRRNIRKSGVADSHDAAPPKNLPDALKDLRARLAAQRGLPPYRILSNAALEGLASQKPLTPDEAKANIKGIGETKARTVIPKFLEIIRSFEA